ncbi:MAG: hypothetical protein ACJA09_004012 [Alcanivorax sp.]
MNDPKLKRDRVLFLGCGDLGIRAGNKLLEDNFIVAGARRDVASLPEKFIPLAIDYTKEDQLNCLADFSPGYVVVSFKPLSPDPKGYHEGFLLAAEKLQRTLAADPPYRTFFVSSTRIFAEQHGGWVDEASVRAEHDPCAVSMLAAEQTMRELGPSTALYFAGLYGVPGGRLLARVQRGELSALEPARYSNRIHRQDAGNFIAHLINADKDGESLAPGYIGCDDEPALHSDVDHWLAERLGVSGQFSSTASRVASGHKRCCNTLLRDSGFELRFPNYQSGYEAVIKAAS